MTNTMGNINKQTKYKFGELHCRSEQLNYFSKGKLTKK